MEVDLTSKDPDNLLKEVEELTNANSLKPKEVTTDNDDGVFNWSSNKLADKSKDIDMGCSEDDLEDILASSTKSVSNKDGVGFAGKVVMGGTKFRKVLELPVVMTWS